MMRKFTLLLLLVISVTSYGQSVSVEPTITPSLFRYNDQITVTYNVTGTSLANLTAAYIWVWIPGTNTNAKYNINPATAAADPAKFTKNVSGGTTTFTITFRPSDFFNGDISAETKLGMLIKGADWANGQSADFITDLWDGAFQIKLNAPSTRPLFVSTNDEIDIQAETPVDADFDLYVNDVLVDEQNATSVYTYTHTVTETSGFGTVRLVATSGSNTAESTFQYLFPENSPVVARPAGIIPGINYDEGNDSKVTLCLIAPGKSSVYVRGDFSEWDITPENLMNRDGEYFWIELSDLTSGTEYGYQYLVDQTLVLADPFADKILDPDDQWIPGTIYPSLKPFPADALSDTWHANRVAVFQTGQEEYEWQVTDFEEPAKEELVIYELLIRDFFDSEQRSYQSLIDTLSYFKTLGVNAIELMPIMEFNGNDSWGYNPTFMFAPDKAYGPKDKLKEFIDLCHQNGIAVILDIAMNHHDMPNPYVLMDFDFTAGRPTAANKWFNPVARHPFNVFFDMNHESAYTKDYLDTVNHYWLNEYRVDGFRFDLSKGFTQTNNPDDVGAWSSYDASRVAIIKRMADEIWKHTPEAYVILEHFADNAEEKELAEYRADEGMGMLVWGNANHQFGEATKGVAGDSDLQKIYHESRNWDVAHLVGYMESHDEERLMVKNMTEGNSAAGGYTVRNTNVSLQRIKAATTMFYAIPGPKMLWQFGELGYDYSINYCSNGTINNDCRVGAKPVRWDYYAVPERLSLFNHTASMINLRHQSDVFTSGEISTAQVGTLFKQFTVQNVPYTATPQNADEMNVVVVANFNVNETTQSVSFPHDGTWYSVYQDNLEYNITGAPQLTLAPGEYRLFTDFRISSQPVTGIEEFELNFRMYPNPAGNHLIIEPKGSGLIREVVFYTQSGKRCHVKQVDANLWDTSELPSGLYIVKVQDRLTVQAIKLIKK